MKKLFVIASTVVLVAAELIFAPPLVLAQKKGQSAKIQHGVVVETERVDLSENKAPTGALVGGSIGLISGGSSGYRRRRNAAIGAITGGVLGAAGSTKQLGVMYTVEVTGGMVKIVTDQTEIQMGDCVMIEETAQGANIRRVDGDVCDPAAAAVVAELQGEFQEEAEECAGARREVAAAESDDELDRALRKMEILCNS